MFLLARVLHSKFCATDAPVQQGFLAALPNFLQVPYTGAFRFYKTALYIPEWRLPFFCGIAASNIALTDYIRAKAMFRPSGLQLETPPGNVAL